MQQLNNAQSYQKIIQSEKFQVDLVVKTTQHPAPRFFRKYRDG